MLVKDRKLLPNAAKPTLYFAEPAIPLEFEFDFDLPTGTTYTLAVDVDRDRLSDSPMASATGAISGNKLTFSLNTRTERFEESSKKSPEAFIEIHDGNDKVFMQDQIPIAPRVHVGSVPSKPLGEYPTVTVMNEAIAAAETAFLAKSSTFTGTITIQRNYSSLLTVKSTLATGRTGIDYVGTGRSYWAGVGNSADTIEALRNCWAVYDVTAEAPCMTISPAGLLWAADISINGTASLSAKLAQIDADLAAGGEGSSFYPPVANYLVNDATYGAVYYLDSTIPSIVFAERVLNLKKVRIRLVSANPAVTGNIVIVPAVDGVDQAPVTLAVGATAATREIEFATAVTGRFSLRRDYAAAADTLDDVTAIVTALRILEV